MTCPRIRSPRKEDCCDELRINPLPLLTRGDRRGNSPVLPDRSWCATFGPDYANRLRRRRARPGDKWHLDEVFIRINGKVHYLWRAVDQHGDVLDILVQPRRDATAAKKFFRRLLKGLQYVPRVIVADGLSS
jgi:DDE domain